METIRSLVKSLDRKESAGRSNINVYYLENADAESLAKTLNEIITGVRKQARPAGQVAGANDPTTITADKATNALIINAIPEDYDALKAIVKQLDIRRKQVFVEALILELSMDATQKLGASLAGILPVGNEGVGFGVMNQVAPGIGALASSTGGVPSVLTQSVEGILAGGFFNLVNVTAPDGTTMRVPALSALINLSKTDTDINILSAPRLLTSDNEEAQIIVGSNVPIITSRLTNAVGASTGSSSGLATSVQVERKDVALTLRFTPQVTEGNLVRLKVFQEITDIAQNSVGSVDQVGPTFTKRLLQNTVVAEDGKTVVLGGLIGNSVQDVITKVPFLGDIPFLGWLFKRKETVERKTNLLIFITPRIIRSADDLAQVTQSNREAMNQFQKTEMKDALKKNKYADAAMEQLKASDSTLPEPPPHE
jgi:general secretion pathway protein D